MKYKKLINITQSELENKFPCIKEGDIHNAIIEYSPKTESISFKGGYWKSGTWRNKMWDYNNNENKSVIWAN